MDSESVKMISYTLLLGTLVYRFVKHWKESKPTKTSESNSDDGISLDVLEQLFNFHIPCARNGQLILKLGRLGLC